MKQCNIDNVKPYLGQAIKEAGMTIKDALAAAQKAGRAKLTDETIATAVAASGWTVGGPVGGTMIKVGEVVMQADLLAARDLLAWMINK